MTKLPETVLVPIKDVKPNPENPRVIKSDKFKSLVKSITEFPEMLQLRPIIVNSEMFVLGGNMRLRACQDAGLKQVPIIIADNLSEEQQREFIVKDNVGAGEWDWDALADKWDLQDIAEWGLNIPDVDAKVESEKRVIPDAVKSNIMVTIPIENKTEFLMEVMPIIEKFGGSFLENDSSTY
jgi:ParB-like chromosome segregation protein Spo0J